MACDFCSTAAAILFVRIQFHVSAGLVVVADVRSKVVAPLLLGSDVCAISSSCVSALLVVVTDVRLKVVVPSLTGSDVCAISTSCVSA